MPFRKWHGYFYDNPEIIDVGAVSLDNLLESWQFELILMDIEGSENFALEGMQALLAACRGLAVEFLPHALANVANVTPQELIEPILPHFSFMYVPKREYIVAKDEIRVQIEQIYTAGEEHDAYIFSRSFRCARYIEIDLGYLAADTCATSPPGRDRRKQPRRRVSS